MRVEPIRALGIDVGSSTVKIAGIGAGGEMVWHLLEPADPDAEAQVERLLRVASRATGDDQVSGLPALVATGCGRQLVGMATRKVTEITCHAKGVFRALGHGGTLVDVGGQDSKVIAIGPAGEVVDFSMNDKCAAGTGRFLENTAARLSVPLDRLAQVALSATDEVSISSTCTVFAESEVVSLIARGVAVPTILKGLHRALVRRVVAMIRTVGLVPPLMLSGGVVLNQAVPRLLEEETAMEIVIPDRPQLMGAYGAALVALEFVHG
jgi:predicted CoA-substrate-specific enzyme activase